tara:strand:- start:403 stop:1368 length:966 start_codon:yes stop_codon:yes gene_type:complete
MVSDKEIKKIAKECVLIEKNAIDNILRNIDANFIEIIRLLLASEGRVIIVAIGKSANIANKITATFNSTGQPAIFLHAADAIHGDLGNIQSQDIVICISKSGNTTEIKSLIPIIKEMGNTIISIIGNTNSYLSRESDFVLDVTVEREACPNNLAPTSSTTAQLVMGDALAVSLLSCREFKSEDFARLHPGGMLGKKLSLTVQNLLDNNCNPKVSPEEYLSAVIIEISNKRLGATAVISEGVLKGVITDGDLRRMLEKKGVIADCRAKDIMNSRPKTIAVDNLAYEALMKMKKHHINQLVVLDGNNYVGIIHMQDIIKEGVI